MKQCTHIFIGVTPAPLPPSVRIPISRHATFREYGPNSARDDGAFEYEAFQS
jgi:hypothetical protein